MDKNWRREEKLTWLNSVKSIDGVKWEEITPDDKNNWLNTSNDGEFASLLPIASKLGKDGADDEAIFKLYSLGVSTNRDRVLYNFDREALAKNAHEFINNYNAEVDRFKRDWKNGKNEDGTPKDLDEFVDITQIKWSESLKKRLKRYQYIEFDQKCIRRAMYRPFTEMYLYLQDVAVDRPGLFPEFFPNTQSELENRVICVPTAGFRDAWSVMITNKITDLHFTSGDGNQCFPFFVYSEDGQERRENITDWALDRFRSTYDDDTISKWDIFYYIYGVLHEPTYRVKHIEDLKRDLPRIPLADDFWVFSKAGTNLAELHLGYADAESWPLDSVYKEDTPLSLRVERMKLNKDKSSLVVNDSFSLNAIPEAALKYRVGNRSPLEWVIDQFQVYKDPRLGIEDNPNRSDDPEFIAKLVERVVRVSVETVEIVAGLPTG